MHIDPGTRRRARIARAAREQRFRGDAAMRVHFVVPCVEDDAGAEHLVGERDRARIYHPGREIVSEHAPAWQGAEVGVVDRSTGQDPQRSDHPALHGGARKLGGDRKSTRLNSSHGYISYAVFCLKKKKKIAHEKRAALLIESAIG